ncbi:MAG: hypothetical protein HY931_00975 [Candidatus Falkowbacteria bacterium]|nr:MAG: hypothetical protein HY931_00975 [Candidatus Falkowbacteria bacterium]
MKKLLAISLAAIMIFSFVALSPILAEQEQEQEREQEHKSTSTTSVKPESNDIKTRQLMSSLEKILTPEQIKNFTNIVRQGNSLYGVRKMASSTEAERVASTTPEKDKGNGNNLSRQFEKIAAPWLLHQYEQIKKVGTALWGLKKMDGDKNQEPKKASSTPKYVTSSQSACVISAIKTKDAALKTNNDATTLAFNNAISSRTTCQEAAINATVAATSTPDLIKQQRSELQLCLQAFKESAHSIKEKAAADHKTVWTAYLNELKICGNSTSTAEALMVEDGGGNILEGIME